MRMTNAMGWSVLWLAAITLAGCGKTTGKATPAENPPANQISGEGHSHEGWWCDEHGVPESVCAQCSSKLAADFKANGDWCQQHDRPESQCFICHPELEGKFADQYEAKYGKKPPKQTAG